MDRTSYDEALTYLYNLQRFGMVFGLSRMTRILELLDNPQNACDIVHIAGTNGKGSVAAFMASALAGAGCRTGLYVSPHLTDFTERISINGTPIAHDEVVALVNTVKPVIETVTETHQQPTFFECVTAMAFCYFAQKNVDIIVLETGLGGRLDATNVCTSLIAVITSIALDHTAILGPTIGAIAREKAGIIKDNGIVVTGTDGEALDVITAAARDHAARLIVVGRDVTYDDEKITGLRDVYAPTIPLPGTHQRRNAALAIAALEQLPERYRMPRTVIEQGIAQTQWPGRGEIVGTAPRIILDGAHNEAAAQALRDVLLTLKNTGAIHLVIGCMNDKDCNAMLAAIGPLAATITATRAASERALDPEIIADAARAYSDKIYITNIVPDALEQAKAVAAPDDIICITGSFFVVGEARAHLHKTTVMPGWIQ